MDHNNYLNPPIEEAICEFCFTSNDEWDLTIPGKLQVELGNEYTGKPRRQNSMSVGDQSLESIRLKLEDELNRVELVNEEGTRLIGVGKDNLSIHLLRPYHDISKYEIGGWEEFEKRITHALKSYIQLTEREQIDWISVRYINKLVIPGKLVPLEEYLKCALLEIDGLPQNYSAFFNRTQYDYDKNHALILAYASLPSSNPRIKECLLDLDVIWHHHDTKPIGKKEILKIIRTLHKHAGNAFEAIITDKARELFNAE
ncbi:MAG: TIGR04255 family protein [Rhodobacteraceae bacterium]|nr:TIGR04255 family protein [Paracoccaceae bacterium]